MWSTTAAADEAQFSIELFLSDFCQLIQIDMIFKLNLSSLNVFVKGSVYLG